MAVFVCMVFLSALAMAQDAKFLLDFREEDDEPGAVYPKHVTDSAKQMIFGNTEVRGFRIANQIMGSFTRAGAAQVLYYIPGCMIEGKFTGDMQCSKASPKAGRIAIIDKGKLLLTIEEYIGASIGKAEDYDGDGMDELLSYLSGGSLGRYYQGAMLSSLKDGKYTKLQTFDGYMTTCEEAKAVKPLRMATRITYLPQANMKMPVFKTEYFEVKCGSFNWAKSTKARFARYKKENF
jgi:hypothetical protein